MKKKIFTLVFAVLLSFCAMAQNAAPSCHMRPNDNVAGDIIMKTVRATITTGATYYCTMQWNAGMEGGAYCGFQDSPDKGHVFIYSIWDPSNGQKITSAYTGSGTIVTNFGGEGTGLKSMNNTIGWSLNEWNTVVTRRWSVGTHTHFGYWIRRGSQNKWYHMVTMDYPVSGIYFQGATNAFLEDWLGTGANKRRFEIKDGFKRKTNGTWQAMTQSTFNRNVEARSANYTNNVDAGISGGAYYMQSGGNTSPSYSGNPPITLSSNPGSSPANPAIAFSITNAATNSLSWSVPASSTPQFKYTIKVNGSQYKTEINSERRSTSISASSGSTVQLIIEDILGRTTTKTATVGGGPNPTPTLSVIYVDSEENSGENGAAVNTVDGNNSTIWHTQWSGASPVYPHEIQLSLGGSFSVSGFTYLPRQDGSQNGMIAGYELYVSTSTSGWGSPVATGTWTNTNALKTVTFAAKTGSYTKLKALSEVNGNPWASAAEINVITSATKSARISSNTEMEINQNNSFEVYPVPVKDRLRVNYELKEAANVTITLYDLSGKRVSYLFNTNQASGNYTKEFEIKEKLNGVYIIQLSTGNSSIGKKIIINN